MSWRIKYVLMAIGMLVLNLLVFPLDWQWDLTEEKIHSSSAETLSLVDAIDKPVEVEVYLDGKLPAVFKQLQLSVRDQLYRMNRRNFNISYGFDNPAAGDVEEVNARRLAFAEEGLPPMRIKNNEESATQLIYPYALFRYGDRKVYVNLLEADRPGVEPEAVVNESIRLLEFKFANALQKLFQSQRYKILFTEGHGELDEIETADLELALSLYYDTERVNLDSIPGVSSDIRLIIIAKPKSAFSDHEKFVLDQYIMNGGRVMFLMDPLRVEEGELQRHGHTAAISYELNLDDLLFRYGIRLNTNLVMDLQATRIPLQVGQVGGQSQYEFFRWPFHLASPHISDHPIVYQLDPVNLRYASTMDVVGSDAEVLKVPILASSPYSQVKSTPVPIDLNMVGEEQSPELYTAGEQLLGVLLEGRLPSLYANRVTQQHREQLINLGQDFVERSAPTKLLVVGDGDIARNGIDQNGMPQELGFNRYENYRFANRDFLLNATEYLINDHNLLALRNKQHKLRLLDPAVVQKDRAKWQTINVIGPILLVLLFWLGFQIFRKRKYGN